MRFKPIIPFIAGVILQTLIVILDIYLIDIDDTGEAWRLFREGLLGLSIFLLFIALNNWHKSQEAVLRDNLLNIIRDVLIIFGTGFILNLFISPGQSFIPDRPVTLTEKVIFYNGIITFVSIFAFIEIFILLKPFIYYRRDRFTQLQYYIFIILVIITAGITAFYNLESPVNLDFTEDTFIPDIALILTIAVSFWVATRNKWIPFLTRKEKYFYFIGSSFYFIALIFLSKWLDEIPKHSILAASFTNSLWLFLFIYSGLAAIVLLFHLPTARVLDRKLKELKSLQSLTTAISKELDFNRLVVLVTKTISEVMESHSCWLILLDPEKNNYYVASFQNMTHNQIESINNGDDGYLSKKILKDGNSIIVESISDSPVYRPLKKIHPSLESIIAVPLFASDKRGLGVLFASKNVRYGFNQDDLTLLEAFANQAIIAIENTRRIQESIEKERLSKEMSIAMEVQQRLLPQNTPKSTCFDIAAINKPASEVGGDYYDFLGEDSKYMILIGDVSGKGTSAAFYMAELKGTIQANRNLAESPIDLLIQTNNSIYDSLDKATFITMSAMLLDEEKGILRYSRAGHNGLLKYSSNGEEVEEINPPGLGLGLVKGHIFDSKISQYEAPIRKGEMYVLYTDGISEAMNEQREEFGEDRLKNIILKSRDLGANEIIERVLAEVSRFTHGTPPHDDMTLIIIKVCNDLKIKRRRNK